MNIRVHGKPVSLGKCGSSSNGKNHGTGDIYPSYTHYLIYTDRVVVRHNDDLNVDMTQTEAERPICPTRLYILKPLISRLAFSRK